MRPDKFEVPLQQRIMQRNAAKARPQPDRIQLEPLFIDFDYKPFVPKPKSYFQSSERYRERLVRMGYEEIGSGAYSTVYSHPKSPDRVIKVCRSRDDWPLFAMYVNSLNTPYAIKVYSIKDHGKFYVALLERVHSVANRTYDRNAECEIVDQLRRGRLRMAKPQSINEAMSVAAVKYAEQKLPGLAAFLRLLRKNSMLDDLHEGNYGFRADGSLVIFDPCTDVANNNVRKRFSTTRYKRAA